jgi:hypothetical protein
MRTLFLRCFTFLLFTILLSVPFLCGGCAVHARVYDPYYHDYHGWAAEEPYYSRWETETHREHRDFNKRSKDEQKEYWDWRHNQH